MRVLFAGSPEIALPAFERLAAMEDVVGVLTNPASQQGRGLAAAPTPIARAALARGIPVLAPERLGRDAREAAAALGADILATFAYGRIFGPKFLALFPYGGLNVHPSILPKYRGPTPIPAAILARDTETGVSVQRLALGMDEGDVFAVRRIPLSGRETTESLSATAAEIGAELLVEVITAIASGCAEARPQEGEPSYCGLLAKEDGLLDFRRTALELDARVRAFYPWPAAFCYLRGQRLAILESVPYPEETWPGGPAAPGTILGLDKSRGIMVQTGEGLLALRRLHLQHKKPLPYREFANGMRDLIGAALASAAGEEPGIPA